ncbi:MAG: CcdB family protein [Dechloromonas sp.]|jgi:toxin CcdB|nr:CcdB family protein [Dechloromonas sp.]
MARFSIYRNPGSDGYLLDVQANILDHLNTRVVVPLLPLSVAPKPAKALNPVFTVAGEPMVMVTQFMAAVPTSLLKLPESSLEFSRSEITAALDLLLQGF